MSKVAYKQKLVPYSKQLFTDEASISTDIEEWDISGLIPPLTKFVWVSGAVDSGFLYMYQWDTDTIAYCISAARYEKGCFIEVRDGKIRMKNTVHPSVFQMLTNCVIQEYKS